VKSLFSRALLREGARYAFASAVALALDFGCYVALIRLAGVSYLVAAPAGFLLGLATVYFLCVRWVFAERRLADARIEFAAFAAIGIAGLALNQLVLYLSVDGAGLGYEAAKIVSAGVVFSFNFTLRKLFLFRRSLHA
jgi:putative flippase GtrA